MTPRRDLSVKYGQVFLQDTEVAQREVNLLGNIEGKKGLEIGCGPGILTRILLERGSHLTGIEPDHSHFDDLSRMFSDYVETGKFNPIKSTFEEFQPADFDFIIGNIPYSHSSAIVFGLVKFGFARAILMVQKEFGIRMAALPGTAAYSRLSVNTHLHFAPRIEFHVSRKVFSPVPDVDSVVVSLVPKHVYLPVSEAVLDDITRKIFSQRRKMLGNVFEKVPTGWEKIRGETLSPEQIVDLAAFLHDL